MSIHFKVSHPKDMIFFNRVISDISVVLRETTHTISDSIETPVECEILGVVSLSTTEITEMTRFKTPIYWVPIPEEYSFDGADNFSMYAVHAIKCCVKFG